MTGLPYWDAAIWGVLGIIAGIVLSVWAAPRSAMIFALVVALIGAGLMPMMFVFLGDDGIGYALMVLFWSVPVTLGLAVGAALSRFWRKD